MISVSNQEALQYNGQSYYARSWRRMGATDHFL